MKTQTEGAAMKPATPKNELPPATQLRKAAFGDSLKRKLISVSVVTLPALLFLGLWPTNMLSPLNAQSLTMDQIKSNLLSNPPGNGNSAVREASLLAFDELLLPNAKPEAIQFYRDQVGKVAQEIQAEAPIGAYIWMMYNHGFIVKTPGAVFAFDLKSEPRSASVILPDEIVKKIDVFFVSHRHDDHYDRQLVSRVIANNGLVVFPSEMFRTSGNRIGMAAGESRSIKNLQVTAHYGEHSVPVRMFEVTCPNGLKFLHTGDNQASWYLPTVQGCVLLLNAWVNESGTTSAAVGMRNSLERVRPLLMIPGHIQELLHDYLPGDPTSRAIYAWAFEVDDEPIAAPIQVMTWGERYIVSDNHPPLAQPQSVSVNEDTPLVIALTASDVDGDALTYTVVTPPSHGTLAGTPPNLTYLGATNYYGSDSFTFKANDGQVDSDVLTIDITVIPVNDPPVAVGRVTPLFQISTNDTNLVVLSPNNIDATVIFDGSISSDVENVPLQYFWFDAGASNAFGSGVVVTNVLEVGTHTIVLIVSDGMDTDTNSLPVAVITPAQAVAELLLLVDKSDIGRRNKRPLLVTLNAAMASFERDNMVAGLNQLEAFENKVHAQIAPFDPALAGTFDRVAQQIMTSVSGP